MTQQRDIERLLDHWFSDGPVQAPDRVVDIVTDRIERESQRPAWRLRWRSSPLNAYTKIAVAAAAVLIVAVAGYNLLPGRSTGVGVPAPSPSPTATPTASTSPIASASPSASPSASALFPSWFTAGGDGAGILPAGRQTTRRFVTRSTFTVPAGWVNESDNAQIYALFPDTPGNEAEYALSKGTAQNVIVAQTVDQLDGIELFFREQVLLTACNFLARVPVTSRPTPPWTAPRRMPWRSPAWSISPRSSRTHCRRSRIRMCSSRTPAPG